LKHDQNILEAIGHTPLVKLSKVTQGLPLTLPAKVESHNPGGSVKDRVALRMVRHEANALEIAHFLQQHPQVEAVHYPGLPNHPQHDLARRQMSGFGGMVTFQMRGGRPQANAFVKALRLFSFAESLGGVESLACHPTTMTHAAFPPEERLRRGITEGTIRLSVGIEDVDDLKADIDQALRAAAL
jgi:cystathionine beta-lyase/cystathionine gamma-synthase